jgi:L-ribulose-5-phosphate 3-epimerase
MNKIDFGFIQGRMIKTPSKKILQYFPKKKWRNEFLYAKKYDFKFIEYFGERKFNKLNPIWNKQKLNEINYLVNKNKLFNYSFCDDFFINNNLLNYKNLTSYYFKLSENLSIIKIKVYVLALFEKSLINKKNFKNFIDKLSIIAEKLDSKKIKLALETNLDAPSIKRLIKLINKKNVFIVYDTGNRLKKKDLQYKEIVKLKNNIFHFHIKDKNWKDENVILGTGNVNFNLIFDAVKKIRYKGKFTFETNRGNNPIKTMCANRDFILDKLKS